jgi:hypothetical protein
MTTQQITTALDDLNATARPHGLAVKHDDKHGYTCWVSPARGCVIGATPEEAEAGLARAIELKPAPERKSAWCRKCGGPVADDSGRCGEC